MRQICSHVHVILLASLKPAGVLDTINRFSVQYSWKSISNGKIYIHVYLNIETMVIYSSIITTTLSLHWSVFIIKCQKVRVRGALIVLNSSLALTFQINW